MNIIAYIIYLFITCLTTVYTGWLFYTSGRVYLLNLLQNDVALTSYINKMLLTGYYLLNIGYAAVMIRFWKNIHSLAELAASISGMTGTIMISLGIIHFFNMAVIYYFSNRNKQHFSNHTNTFL